MTSFGPSASTFSSRARAAFLPRIAPAAMALSFALLTGCGSQSSIVAVDQSHTKVAVNISGTVHGGQNPISFSSLQLWAVGSGGYGSTATELTKELSSSPEFYPGGTTGCSTSTDAITFYNGTGSVVTFTAANTLIVGQLVQINDTKSGIGGQTLPVLAATNATFSVADTVDNAGATDGGSATPICYATPTSDINGNFTISGDYTLPSTATQVYITATSGNPGLTPATATNSAIKLAAPLGLSTGLSATTPIIISEATTAAMAIAAAQYFTTTFGITSTDSFGATSTTQGQLGLTNALNTVALLANSGNGNPMGTQVLGTATTGTVTATPETAKVGLIADILAACVNSTGPTSTACGDLFADTVTTSGTKPTDTLQAAVYMGLNPTSTNSNSSTTNITQLTGLATATSPFAGYHSGYAQPTDWTIGIGYGLSTQNSSTIYTVDEPEYFAIDGSGDIWIANYVSGNYNLTELSPIGTPLYSSASTLTLASTYSVIVDPSGNVWVADSGGTSVTKFTPGTTPTTVTFTTANTPYSLASDGKGNIFVLEGAAGAVQEITSGSAANGSTALPYVGGTGTTALPVASKYATIAVDSNYNLWITNAATSLYEIPYSSSSSTYASSVTTVSPTQVTAAEPVVIDGSNNVWAGNYVSGASQTLAKVPAATPTTAGSSSFTVTGATSGLEGLAVDGAGDIWVSNYSTTTAGAYELSNSGTELSPTVGFAHTVYHPKGIAVDQSGSVWVGGTNTATYAQELTKIVGAAVPVVTPIAAGLPTTAGGTNLLGSKP